MVNTMVKNPENRKLNRRLDRQKKARMKLNRKALVYPSDSSTDSLVDMHTRKITELKKERDKFRATSCEAELRNSV